MLPDHFVFRKVQQYYRFGLAGSLNCVAICTNSPHDSSRCFPHVTGYRVHVPYAVVVPSTLKNRQSPHLGFCIFEIVSETRDYFSITVAGHPRVTHRL